MPNRYRGEKSFEANGRTYTMRVGTLQIAQMENALNVRGQRLFSRLNESGFDDQIQAFRICLLESHPEMDNKTASEILDALGHRKADDILTDAINMALLGPEYEAEMEKRRAAAEEGKLEGQDPNAETASAETTGP